MYKSKLSNGVSNLTSNHPNINQINVVSTDEMYTVVNSIFQIQKYLFLLLRQLDYKPKNITHIK